MTLSRNPLCIRSEQPSALLPNFSVGLEASPGESDKIYLDGGNRKSVCGLYIIVLTVAGPWVD